MAQNVWHSQPVLFCIHNTRGSANIGSERNGLHWSIINTHGHYSETPYNHIKMNYMSRPIFLSLITHVISVFYHFHEQVACIWLLCVRLTHVSQDSNSLRNENVFFFMIYKKIVFLSKSTCVVSHTRISTCLLYNSLQIFIPLMTLYIIKINRTTYAVHWRQFPMPIYTLLQYTWCHWFAAVNNDNVRLYWPLVSTLNNKMAYTWAI